MFLTQYLFTGLFAQILEGGEESHEGGGEHRERRPPRRPRFENNRRGDFHGHDAQHAPKVHDERDFPSLG